MASRRSIDEWKLVLQMHERGNSYDEISTLLGIPKSTCHDVVRRFNVRGDLRDAHLEGRPRILHECIDHEVVRLLLDPSNNTAATVGRKNMISRIRLE